MESMELSLNLSTFRTKDWIAVGSLLDGISTSVKKWHPRYSFLAIDDAARKLMELTNPALLQDIKKETVRRPFFWEPQKRVNFWVHDIPKALGINSFVAKIYNYPNWRLPWSTRINPQLLKAMNNYRKEKAEKERESLENQNEQPEEKDTDYNVNDPQQYVKCISGAYSHAEELHGKVLAANGNPIPIDSAVQRSDPELCIVLYSLLTD
ncbi:uncharacterized protein LOC100842716 [Brachypodium distachyon]|uniref:Uncharacterized protein n=1 Tax=Brachypodium distachyon TaxID=15368 RepID=A0A2K2DJB4_BRADI|nr:uncharacterized protein LOC100842716 [Brachypodium distachyon]XP_010231915.1 uncharacterized protein LOC100842716 [Brachypodium distachyon]XP_024312259.1 uncharacterized protein LOC100842716 [Brachypodium distachyon]PNT74364.1 hypothetical protein BRADI_1g13387v3 [Brachypodium distachyon]PNT74365.1 hypothetical protein BRADI_1g13387v3 [Brachypodium distachyon]PNT74366.1 hypothetical protein BRADI_1g13387v3 [Brachypodium distachyon]PNT74367.1 hypothetical protein BRADI_1g13387v3 [Brachypodi|eukprot:XP_003561674.2 uncharacterized protein LOC100842716 [Brachypodium distachyon]